MTTVNTIPTNAITCEESKLVTTSLKVAEAFGKRHSHVLEKIKNLDCSKAFRSANFSAHPHKNEQNGETYTAWHLTKDGFMFLVMGFTGKKAAAIKEAYITAFNIMAEKLNNLQYGTLSPAQQRQIQQKVGSLAHSYPSEQRPGIYNRVYGKLKTTFGVAKYEQIPAHLFSQALILIEQFNLNKPTTETVPAIEHQHIDLAESSVLQSYKMTAFNYGSTLLPTPMAALLNQLMLAEENKTPVLVTNVRTAARDLDGLLGLLQQYDMIFKQIHSLSEPSKHV
ncbi:Rha family transcriptional regulator [Pseudoalteromonas shioyasakiensis]|uniref:Rha family transcriptional regulator n=1 Tax=Pseudoalteromonas shioyasakiensis TaxID=1190813 RepID=UPI0022B17292|nr:Rha family transcriptional regulator [Pseudoalteromonas shioyasakiensis]MCZ4253456.1 Rha family transcriptional regulator [Pseudoalteromonas shioyasakiensis]